MFGNETEAAAYSEAHSLGTSDVGEIALKIAQLPKVGAGGGGGIIILPRRMAAEVGWSSSLRVCGLIIFIV